MQRAEVEMNIVRDREMDAQKELQLTEQHLAHSRAQINMAMSEGSAQSKALFESQANAEDVADNAHIHLEQMRYEKDLQRQEYETQLEDLRKKATLAGQSQTEKRKNFRNS